MRYLFCLGLLTGCGSSAKGEIGGESPDPIRSGMWYPTGDGNNRVITVQIASFPKSCEAYAASFSASADAYLAFKESGDVDALVADLTAAEQENVPSDYWSFNLTLVRATSEEVEDDYSVEAKDVVAGAYHQLDYTDYEKVKVDRDDSGIHGQSYYATGGTAEIKKFKDEGALSGSAELALTAVGSDEEGAVQLNLQVSYCEEAGQAYADYLAAIAGF